MIVLTRNSCDYSQESQPISDGLAALGRSAGMLTAASTGAAANAGVAETETETETGAWALVARTSFLTAPVDFSMPLAPMDLR